MADDSWFGFGVLMGAVTVGLFAIIFAEASATAGVPWWESIAAVVLIGIFCAFAKKRVLIWVIVFPSWFLLLWLWIFLIRGIIF